MGEVSYSLCQIKGWHGPYESISKREIITMLNVRNVFLVRSAKYKQVMA